MDRIFDEVVWTPASTSALCCGTLTSDPDGLADYRLSAERRALELRLPLIWPERFPEEVPAAMRAAHYASEQGRGAAFVLAAGRLAFCGGFDLDDPELLAEAAAAAGIDMQGWLSALTEMHRDGEIDAAGRRLLAAGADRLPAMQVGDALFWGEHRSTRPRPRPGIRRRAPPGSRADEPGEDAGVDLLLRGLIGVPDLGQDRVLAVGLAQQQLEVRGESVGARCRVHTPEARPGAGALPGPRGGTPPERRG